MLCTFRGQRPWRQSIQLLAAMAAGSRPTFPDFEEEVRGRAAFAAPLVADLQYFGDLVLRRRLAILVDLCCVAESGRFALGLHVHDLRASVRPGDEFLGGVLFSGDCGLGTCQVAPRLLRVVCRNGAVLPTDQEIESESYVRSSAETASGDLEEVVATALSLRTVASATSALRGAALTPSLDPIRELRRLGLDLLEPDANRLLAGYRRGRDRTLYGAYNALTEAARDTTDLAERERLERLAGRMVPRFRRSSVHGEIPALV
jgi:hypothetical protein